jgi:hypothetical protein
MYLYPFPLRRRRFGHGSRNDNFGELQPADPASLEFGGRLRRKSQAGPPPVKRVFVMIVITAPGSDRLPAGPMRGNPLPPGICHSADRCFHATPPSVCRMMPAEITGAKVWLVERTRMEYLRSSSLPLHRPGIGPQRCALWVRADADATERKGRWGSCFW